MVNADIYALNREQSKPVTLLFDAEINEGLDLVVLRESLCERVPVNRIFYAFVESPSPSSVAFRRQIRGIFKEGQKWSSEFMSFKLSRYYVDLAQLYRKTEGYTLKVHDHAEALELYREALNWWPHFQALMGAAYLVLFDEERFRNREEGEAYLSQILEPNPLLRKFTSDVVRDYYKSFALEFQKRLISRGG